MNVDTEKRIEMETMNECCYATSYLSDRVVKNVTFNQGYVFCDCPVVHNYTVIREDEETNECEVLMRETKFCCDGKIVEEVHFGVYLLMLCISFVLCLISAILGFVDLQRNANFFSKIIEKVKAKRGAKEYTQIEDNSPN